MKLRMYKAKDSLDGRLSMFAVSGNKMAVSTAECTGEMWGDPEWFTDLSHWNTEPYKKSRMIDPELIWEKEV